MIVLNTITCIIKNNSSWRQLLHCTMPSAPLLISSILKNMVYFFHSIPSFLLLFINNSSLTFMID